MTTISSGVFTNIHIATSSNFRMRFFTANPGGSLADSDWQ